MKSHGPCFVADGADELDSNMTDSIPDYTRDDESNKKSSVEIDVMMMRCCHQRAIVL